jgi:hypothetical protein
MAMKSRRVFAPEFIELDFWKMFFMSRDISFLPKRRRTALALARRGIRQSEKSAQGLARERFFKPKA